jgi:hypothetical protein
MNYCCEGTNPSVTMKRCVINQDVNTSNPYSASPYFAIQRQWNLTNIFTIKSLVISGIEYADNQQITVNYPVDVQVAPGVDGRVYYTNLVDFLNSLIPSSTGVVFRDDMNVVDAPVGTSYQVIISYTYGVATQYYKYNSLGFFISIDEENGPWTGVGGNSTVNCFDL